MCKKRFNSQGMILNVFQKSYFRIGMWHSRPPPFMANTILNFHFDYWNTSLTDNLKSRDASASKKGKLFNGVF